MNVNFEEVIINAIKNKWTGRIIFLGLGGIVRVVFIEGKIKDVDSTWDSSPKELERIKEWKEGVQIVKKKLKKTLIFAQIVDNCCYENNLIDRFFKKCEYSFEKTKNFKLNKFFIIFFSSQKISVSIKF